MPLGVEEEEGRRRRGRVDIYHGRSGGREAFLHERKYISLYAYTISRIPSECNKS